jgi:hypothetical protein
MFNFSPSQHEALKEGLITASGRRTETVHESDLKYVLINLHCPGSAFQFPDPVEASLPQDKELLNDYLRAEQDSGISDLSRSILEKNSGGLGLTVNPPRGVVDTIWYDENIAVRNILSGEEAGNAKKILMSMHGKILNLFKTFFNALPKGTRVISLHSMEPYNSPNQPKPLTPLNIREYVNAYGSRPLNDETKRENNLIVGQAGQPSADMEMVHIVEEILKKNRVNSVRNKPYAPDPRFVDWDCYGSSLKRGNSGFVIDILKTNLCKGEGFDRSFDTTRPVIDENKVENMSQIFSEALRMVLR